MRRLSWCKSPLNAVHVNDPTLIYTTGESASSVHICPLRINKQNLKIIFIHHLVCLII